VYPSGDWNYVLVLSEDDPAGGFEIEKCASPADPFTAAAPPLRVRAKARKVRGWKIRRPKTAIAENTEKRWRHDGDGELEFTPDLPDPTTLQSKLGKRVYDVTLVPYGCTHVRLTVFPVSWE
jgi:hypothetical protein